MSRRLQKAFVLALVAIFSLAFPIATVYPQQSTTGPIPPANMDLGLRPPARSQHVMYGVPPYLWRHGCGPTALGMVIGFWNPNCDLAVNISDAVYLIAYIFASGRIPCYGCP